jgi:hypothetical protein
MDPKDVEMFCQKSDIVISRRGPKRASKNAKQQFRVTSKLNMKVCRAVEEG